MNDYQLLKEAEETAWVRLKAAERRADQHPDKPALRGVVTRERKRWAAYEARLRATGPLVRGPS